MKVMKLPNTNAPILLRIVKDADELCPRQVRDGKNLL
ncbi:hypothetical protein R69927_01451 [Paraburkholderia domus]|nr:hypothetical protein R75483_00310 [Paraburkholderia domus]CAE6838395.1 hypothetical protein R69927_01451 [Paraburkholderia domus]